MITRPTSTHRSRFALASLALALGTAPVAAGCDPAIGEIGLHPLPPPSAQPGQIHPTPGTATESTVEQPIAPIAPLTGSVGPVVPAPAHPQPVPDAAPTDVAPKADD